MRITALTAVVTLFATPAFAGPHVAAMTAHAKEKVSTWVQSEEVIEAVKAQNAAHAALDEAKINQMDQAWRAETAAASQPMIEEVLERPISVYLGDVKEEAAGLYTEIFVMDAKGLNVGQSDITSDYWQGDEAKWKETYLKGPDAVHVSDVELDESTQSYQSQLSVPVTDPETKEVIGAVTIGIDVDLLML